MVRVENGKVVEVDLPLSGTLKDGRTVSNYNLLPIEILLEEGWLPLEQVVPSFYSEKEYPIHEFYLVEKDKVIEYFKIESLMMEGYNI